MYNVANVAPPVPTTKGFAGYKALSGQKAELLDQFRNLRLVENEVERFKERMAKVDTAAEATGDFRTFNFLLSAYGLEGFDYANALVERALREDVDAPNALANRLKNPAFREMAADFQAYLEARESGRSGRASGHDARSAEARAQARLDVLKPVGERMGLDRDAGESPLGERLAQVRSELRELAGDPDDPSRQSAAVGAAEQAGQRINGIADAARDARDTATTRIRQEVEAVNSALERIHELNGRIAGADLLDRNVENLKEERARQIDRVAEALQVRVETGEQGRVDLYTHSGLSLLDDTQRRSAPSADHAPLAYADGKLKVDGTDVTPTGDAEDRVTSGRLAGLFEVRDKDLAALQDRLDTLAEDLVQTFQDHRTDGGVDPTTGGDPDGDSEREATRQGLFVDDRASRPYSEAPYPTGSQAPNDYATAGSEPYEPPIKDGLAGNLKINADVTADPALLQSGVYGTPATVSPDDDSQVLRFAGALAAGDRSSTADGAATSLIGKAESIVSSFEDKRAELDRRASGGASDDRTGEEGRTPDKLLDRMAERYTTRMFEKAAGRNAPAVAQAVRFKRTIGDANFLYNVISDEKNYEVIRKAFNIPDQILNTDVAAQKERLAQAVDLQDLKSAERQEEIVRRFLAVASVESVSGVKPEDAVASTPAVSLLGGGSGPAGAGGRGGGGGSAVLPGMSGSTSSLLSTATSAALSGGGLY